MCWFQNNDNKILLVSTYLATILGLSACSGTYKTQELDKARVEYSQAAENDLIWKNDDADEHLEKAAAALDKASYYQSRFTLFNVTSVREDIDLYLGIALREIEMAELLSQTEQTQLKIAQLKLQMGDELLAAKERRQLARQEEKLNKALAKSEVKGADIKRDKEQILVTFRDLIFDFDKSRVKPDFKTPLYELAEALKSFPDRKLTLLGYTDNIGKSSYNKSLSEKRAIAVKTFLINRGVDAKRITSNGYGDAKPVASNDTPEGRQKNRRVELVISYPPISP